jgi:hypothetical protein
LNSFIVQLKGRKKKNSDRALELQEEAATIVYDALDVYLKTVSGTFVGYAKHYPSNTGLLFR